MRVRAAFMASKVFLTSSQSLGKLSHPFDYGDLRATSETRNPRPLSDFPFDGALYHELNVERYELAKTGTIQFSHPDGSKDDRFWSLALRITAAQQQRTSALIRVQ